MAGEGAEDKNCYVAYVFQKDGNPFLKIENVDSEKIHGKAISESYGYDLDTSLGIDAINQKQLVIEHYYGLMTLRTVGIFDFIISKATHYHYIKYHLKNVYSKFDQYTFNKKELGIVRKQQLLNVLLERHLDRPNATISPIDLMTRLHSINWLLHPDSDTEQKRLILYLKALAESGEIARQSPGYTLMPKAILSLEELDDTVRRHEELAKTQKRLVIVTWALVAVTLLLALGELPILLGYLSVLRGEN